MFVILYFIQSFVNWYILFLSIEEDSMFVCDFKRWALTSFFKSFNFLILIKLFEFLFMIFIQLYKRILFFLRFYGRLNFIISWGFFEMSQ